MLAGSRIWQTLAALFAALNLAGAGFAAWEGEGGHALVHVALAIVSGYLAWWLGRDARLKPTPALPTGHAANDRIDYLQQSVDAIALEVERIGEAQRFDAKLRAEQPQVPRSKPEP